MKGQLLLLLIIVPYMMYAQDDTTNVPTRDLSEIVDFPDEEALFGGGGFTEIEEFLFENLKYPVDSFDLTNSYRVIIGCTIEKDGSLSNIECEKSSEKEFNEEALRVVRLMPNWTPATYDGKPVRSRILFPVDFDKFLKDEEAEFPGGQIGLEKYIDEAFVYPHDAIVQRKEGRVFLSFIVEKDGSISSVKLEAPLFPSLDAEAIRLMEEMPTWVPGRVKGKAVRVKCRLPMTFHITKELEKQARKQERKNKKKIKK